MTRPVGLDPQVTIFHREKIKLPGFVTLHAIVCWTRFSGMRVETMTRWHRPAVFLLGNSITIGINSVDFFGELLVDIFFLSIINSDRPRRRKRSDLMGGPKKQTGH